MFEQFGEFTQYFQRFVMFLMVVYIIWIVILVLISMTSCKRVPMSARFVLGVTVSAILFVIAGYLASGFFDATQQTSLVFMLQYGVSAAPRGWTWWGLWDRMDGATACTGDWGAWTQARVLRSPRLGVAVA